MTDIRCIEDMVVYFQRVLKAREEKNDKEKERSRGRGQAKRRRTEEEKRTVKTDSERAAGALDPAGRTAVGTPCISLCIYV